MNIIRWQPLTELMTMRQAMDRLFEDSFTTPFRLIGATADGLTTPIDIYHTDKDIVVKAALPGVKPEEVDITVTGDTLNIKGETKAEEEIKQEDYLYRERHYGTFHRTVVLPSGLNTDKSEAKFEDGMLTLTIPKLERTKPKAIKVKAEGSAKSKKVKK